MENARLLTETREALDQQTATAEVLQVINSSPGDLAPIFDAILEKAHKVCGAALGSLGVFEGDTWRAIVQRGYGEPLASTLRQGVRGSDNPLLQELIDGAPFVHIADLVLLDLPIARANVAAGIRALLVVALRKDDALLGTISIARREPRPFSDKEIALLENFAAQAVIAMENARLITETQEALEQQTATAEVLQVINSSPGDLAPVFDAILEKAMSLCEAAHGHIWTYDGESARPVALRGDPQTVQWMRQFGPVRPGATPMGRVVRGERIVHVADARQDDAYRSHPAYRDQVDACGIRTILDVALRKDDTLLGILAVYRQEVRPFTDKHIALLENFAAQAVIAMENARLLTETREALEQQTATAEVLQVINSSPGDLAPVFDAMLERAMRLCEASFAVMLTREGQHYRFAAARGISDRLAEYLRKMDQPSHDGAHARLSAGASFIHLPDLTDDDAYRSGSPLRRAMVEFGGARTALVVPLQRDGNTTGTFNLCRAEIRPFSDKQIALLQNFAAQAVIAMENARLINETREALEQQTATAEVLQVINASPGDLTPVFDAMLEKAVRLCEAAFGMFWIYEGDRTFQATALRGVPEGFAEFVRKPQRASHVGSGLSRLLHGEHLVINLDMAAEQIYQAGDPLRRAIVDLGGARTAITVALRKDETLLGAFTAYRQEVRPFSDKEIALLQNFAAQAVIAMENARLLGEIRQRQSELRVTFDNMGDGVVMFDEHLRLAAWNRNFQEMLDLPDTDLAERPSYSDYVRILAERGEFGAGDIEEELSRRLENTTQEFRQERPRPDGRVIEVRRNAVPDGGFVLIYSDITERKRSEAEIRAARDAAEAAYRDLKAAQASLIQAEKMASLGQLTAGIAHEIKNPLNFVNNFADLSVELLDELKETATPAIASLGQDKRTEIDETIGMLTGNLEKIAEHGRRADGIVKSMLEHSRGTSGERRSIDLNDLIDEALNLAYHGARAQDASFNITLERDFAEAIAPIELVPQDITRVCLNLISNGFYAATKRQKEGGDPKFKPTLRVSTRDLGDSVEINIRDNGVDIPPEIKDKFFQPFFTTKPTGEGTGLGLSISYDIVTQEHGGTISVDSQIGEFTEFTVRLPRTFGATIAEAAS